jgi:hypothetical protein
VNVIKKKEKINNYGKKKRKFLKNSKKKILKENC